MRYVISYSLSNVISFPGEHDEFYWDINGDEWSQPFGVVKAKIHIPDSLVPSLQERSRCFTGSFGSTETNCQTQRQVVRAGADTNFDARDLTPGENLSVVLGFNQGTFFEDPWPARKRLLLAASAVIPPALIVWYSFRRWRRIGRDYPSRGVVIPQYAPPDDLNVLGADVVLN